MELYTLNNVNLSAAQTSTSTQEKISVDPLAQSFTIDTPGGAFLTSLNLYFSAKDSTIPVSIDIRVVEDGVPTGVIVPFSSVTVAASAVNVSTDASIATKFTFPSPVFLLDGTSYCFVVNANSYAYKIWTARTGAADITRYPFSVIKQPYSGSLFRSQNTGVWSPDTTKDIKFDINRAEFDASGTIVLNEAGVDTTISPSLPVFNAQLDPNPFETYVTALNVTSYTTPASPGSPGYKIVTATLGTGTTASLGIAVNSRITIAGAYDEFATPVESLLNYTWTVTGITTNTFTFDTSESGAVLAAGLTLNTARIGHAYLGSTVVRVHHQNHGFCYEDVSEVTFSDVLPDTTANLCNGIPVAALNDTFTIKTIEQDSYTIEVLAADASASAGRTGGNSVRASENRIFDTIQPNVQSLTFQNTATNWAIKAYKAKSLAGSEGSTYSVDTEYTNVVLNQKTDMDHPRVIRTDIVGDKSFTLRGQLSTENRALSPVIDLNRSSLITFANRIDNPTNVVTAGYNYVHDYQPETTAAGSSALAKYITKKIDLNTPAAALRAFVFANRPSGSAISVYYKVLPKGSDKNFDLDIGWTAASPITEIPVTDDTNSYFEAEYAIEEADLSNREFTSFAFKVVFTSTNSCAVPTIKNFRAIAVT